MGFTSVYQLERAGREMGPRQRRSEIRLMLKNGQMLPRRRLEPLTHRLKAGLPNHCATDGKNV